jgi:hypothetical protein
MYPQDSAVPRNFCRVLCGKLVLAAPKRAGIVRIVMGGRRHHRSGGGQMKPQVVTCTGDDCCCACCKSKPGKTLSLFGWIIGIGLFVVGVSLISMYFDDTSRADKVSVYNDAVTVWKDTEMDQFQIKMNYIFATSSLAGSGYWTPVTRRLAPLNYDVVQVRVVNAVSSLQT